jgi:Ca2+-binding RTX toxin-like protein
MANSTIKLTNVNTSDLGPALPANGNVVMTFSGPIFVGKGKYTLYDNLNRIVASGDAASGHVSINGNVLTIDFPSDLQFRTYYRLSPTYDWLTDAAGNAISFYGLSFWTKSSDAAVNLVGTDGPDTLAGSSQDDMLDGAAGNDVLYGYEGNDKLYGGAGSDSLDGGEGNDTLAGGAGGDALDGAEGDDVIDGGDGDDMIYDRYGDNILKGGGGNDRIDAGYYASSVIDGGDGNDEIWGHGADAISGGSGDDVIFVYGNLAANGRGTIHAGDGADHITVPMYNVPGAIVNVWGEGGIDAYELRMPQLGGAATLIIRDFTPGAGGDVLNVNLLTDPDLSKGNPFGPNGQLRLEQDGADVVLVLTSKNPWTSTVGDQMVRLAGVQLSQLTRDNFLGGYSPDGIGTEGMVVLGTSGNDNLNGAYLNDRIVGNAGDDFLHGNLGDDVLVGGAGNDDLDGGPGTDTAVIAGLHDNFTIERTGEYWYVTARTGSEGRDLLRTVERVLFSDKAIALDVGGAAGKVYRLYQAAYDRKPDAGGLGFWISQADNGVTQTSIAEGFIGSAEFKALYGTAPSNDALVSRMYKNVLHRDPDASGKAFWVDVLDRKAATVAEVLMGFSESPENVAFVGTFISSGFEYQPWQG